MSTVGRSFVFRCFVVSLFRCFVVSSFRCFVVSLFRCFVVSLFRAPDKLDPNDITFFDHFD